MVVQRKIIRKVNDNDDGRVVMQARPVTAVYPFAFRLSARFCLMRAVLSPVFRLAFARVQSVRWRVRFCRRALCRAVLIERDEASA